MHLPRHRFRMPAFGPLLAIEGFGVSQSSPADKAGAIRARDAIKVLDLRAIRKLNLGQVYNDSATHTTYSSQSSLAAAVAYHKAELVSRGWEERQGPAEAVETPEYTQRFFGKEGSSVRLTLSAFGEDMVMVSLSHLGDVPMVSLPRPEGAQPVGEPRPMIVTYTTPREFLRIAAECRRELAARGWHECGPFRSSHGDTPHLVAFNIVKGAATVFVSIAEGRGESTGKTFVSYLAQPVLAIELPMVDDASEVKLNAMDGHLEYRSNRDKASLAAFYRDAYRAEGYSDATPEGADHGVLIFSDRDGSRLTVRLINLTTGGRRVVIGPSPRKDDPTRCRKPADSQAEIAADAQPEGKTLDVEAGELIAIPLD
jgi:hypothetical protein